MKLKKIWFWQGYFLFYLMLAAQETYRFFAPDSPLRFYYYFLYHFEYRFLLKYLLHYLQVILVIVHIVPLMCFILKKRFLHPDIWKYLLILRITFDIFAPFYVLSELSAYLKTEPWLGVIILCIRYINFLPSYIACYQYAFHPDSIQRPQ